MRFSPGRRGIGRIVIVIILIIVVVLSGVGGVYVARSEQSSSSVSSSSSINSTSSSGTGASSAIGSSATTASGTPTTLVYDDACYECGGSGAGINNLFAVDEDNWPNWMAFTVYQPLVLINVTAEYQDNAIQYIPSLASNWTISPDGRTYTFNLRHGVTFSNGDPFNAYQVWAEEYGYYYLSGNSSGWMVGYPVFDMSNVRFGPSTIALMTSSGVTHPTRGLLNVMTNSSWPIYVTSQYQIVFHLTDPFNWLPSILIYYMMFDVQDLLQHGGFGTPTAINTYYNTNPLVGTGPYYVSKVSNNAYVELTQSPASWGRNLTAAQIKANPYLDPGHVQNVVVQVRSDELARYSDLTTGAAQFVQIDPNDFSSLANNTRYSYFKPPATIGYINDIAFNTHEYPTNVTDVRLAIAHAINYSHIIQTVYNGLATPIVGPEVPEWSSFYDLGKFASYQYNITLAKQYLARANITNFPTIDFVTYSGCAACLSEAQIVQSDLTQIGINTNIVQETPTTFFSTHASYQLELQNASSLGQMSMTPSYAAVNVTPAEYWIDLASNRSIVGNLAVYNIAVVDKCIDAFFRTTNTTQIQMLCAAHPQFYDDAPYALYAVNTSWEINGAGSVFWNNNLIKSVYFDILFSADGYQPIFNTVTFAGS